ncbi:MAG TPA: hypothetical protein VNT52_14210, partial [Acidimicrobiales bacterium]|nr:hypothetical protein [Acidimicrobiales bacterium]
GGGGEDVGHPQAGGVEGLLGLGRGCGDLGPAGAGEDLVPCVVGLAVLPDGIGDEGGEGRGDEGSELAVRQQPACG